VKETAKKEIADRIIDAVAELAPDATFRSMYGGTVIEMQKDNPKSRIGGVFVYADYVSLEFTKGAFLDDPNRVLEGSGKMRRHIKLQSVDHILAKGCLTLFEQAIMDLGLT
jgi:hypothetical protein